MTELENPAIFSAKEEPPVPEPTPLSAEEAERSVVRELAGSHSCDSHWAGDHCTICSSFRGAARQILSLTARQILSLTARLATAEAEREWLMRRIRFYEEYEEGEEKPPECRQPSDYMLAVFHCHKDIGHDGAHMGDAAGMMWEAPVDDRSRGVIAYPPRSHAARFAAAEAVCEAQLRLKAAEAEHKRVLGQSTFTAWGAAINEADAALDTYRVTKEGT